MGKYHDFDQKCKNFYVPLSLFIICQLCEKWKVGDNAGHGINGGGGGDSL